MMGCGALVMGVPAEADITVAGTNVGTTHTIVAGDVIDFGSFGVMMDDPGTLTMTGGDVSANGGTGSGVFMTGGSFNMTGGMLGGGTGTGSGLSVNGGTATIGGTAQLRGGTNSSSTGSGLLISDGSVTINGGAFSGGGSNGGAFNIGGGQVDIFAGTFDAAFSGSGFGLSIINDGEVNIYGGSFIHQFRLTESIGDPELHIFNGQFDEQIHILGGTTTIYGTAFSVNSVPVAVGSLPFLVTDNTATIDVTYFDSSTESIDINRFGQGLGTVILTNVPEPGSAMLLVMGGAIAMRRLRPTIKHAAPAR